MRRAVVVTFLLLGAVAPAGASAAAGPAPPVLGGAGVTVSGSPFNYIALAVGPKTLVERVRRAGGTVESTGVLSGGFGIPGVTLSGVTTGLSADGRTLVLVDLTSGFASTHTRLVVLETVPQLHVRTRIELPGYFAVDAISPTGRWLYFTHYRLGSGPSDYEIRAYDLMHRQLLAKPVVDPRHPDEKMTGVPAARIMSADGRWAYTLYQSFTGAPFVHALDTAGRTAFCIDLPQLNGQDVTSATLALSHGALQIDTGGTPAALMDTRTFAVSVPSAVPPRPQPRRATTTGGGASFLLWALGIGLSAVLIALVLVARRRRRTGWRERSSIHIDIASRIDPVPDRAKGGPGS
jgi:hypothetical protein